MSDSKRLMGRPTQHSEQKVMMVMVQEEQDEGVQTVRMFRQDEDVAHSCWQSGLMSNQGGGSA